MSTDNNDPNHNNNEGQGAGGGVVRRMMQTVFTIKKRVILKMAKHSDKISDVSDIVIKVSNTVDLDSKDNGSSSSSSSSNNNNNNNNSNNTSNKNTSSKYFRLVKQIPYALPSVISNIVIGTISFLPYENRHYYSHATSPISLTPMAAGVIGGMLSGILTTTYDKFSTWNTNYSTNRSIKGTVLSHSVVHASLFASYERSRCYLYQALITQGVDDDSALYTAAASGGMIAGIISEIVSHFVAPFEMNMRLNKKRFYLKCRQQLSTIRRQTILLQSIPSSFGFLAYEFGLRNL